MSNRARIGAFAIAILTAFGGAFLIGSALPQRQGRTAVAATGPEVEPAATDHSAHMVMQTFGGLSVADAGYLLSPEETILTPGKPTTLRFRVLDANGATVRTFKTIHEKKLHLIVVRRDMTNYQHLHPSLASDGTWSISLTLPVPGTYRMFADFAPTGLVDRDSIILGADLFSGGETEVEPLHRPTASTDVSGLRVKVETQPRAGEATPVKFTITRNGLPVDDLEPFLGAFGHLIALREGDLAYLHVHPPEAAKAGSRGGPSVTFTAQFPTAGRYALFLDFARNGRVFDAPFTVDVLQPGAPAQDLPAAPDDTMPGMDMPGMDHGTHHGG